MARDDLHFRLRIPEDLKQKVEKSAKDNHRSMTAEIIARLEVSFLEDTPVPYDLLAEVLTDAIGRLADAGALDLDKIPEATQKIIQTAPAKQPRTMRFAGGSEGVPVRRPRSMKDGREVEPSHPTRDDD